MESANLIALPHYETNSKFWEEGLAVTYPA